MNHSAAHYIPLFSTIPFILMLLSIAVMPLIAQRFWHSNKNKLIVALILGIPTAVWLMSYGYGQNLFHTMVFDYVPFLILLGSLFVITGGIQIDGNLESRPMINSIFLAIGAVLASFMGTTGAAMLLVRPLLHTNKGRKFKVHTVLFFIAIVANCGGLLTPLGDPPLFMMYLRGAEFSWFFKLAPEWFFTNLILIIVYYFVDTKYWKKESDEARIREHNFQKSIKIHGKINFIFLAGVVLSVAFLNAHTFPVLGSNPLFSFVREAALLLFAFLSLKMTLHIVRVENGFEWEPIVEVAYLFLGIFITMVPCLIFLEVNAETLGVNTTTMFYYFTGGLSSFLDNTPTAVTFYSLAKGLVELEPQLMQGMPFIAGIPEPFMKAICTGAVFFGSMTYIGNGPNFMVKSIAESMNVKMPHFFGYMYKFSLIVLLPIFIIIQLLFM